MHTPNGTVFTIAVGTLKMYCGIKYMMTTNLTAYPSNASATRRIQDNFVAFYSFLHNNVSQAVFLRKQKQLL